MESKKKCDLEILDCPKFDIKNKDEKSMVSKHTFSEDIVACSGRWISVSVLRGHHKQGFLS